MLSVVKNHINNHDQHYVKNRFYKEYQEKDIQAFEYTKKFDKADITTENVLVTEENVCIQTSGKIRCVSESVEILDNKLARAMEAGAAHPAFVVYK